MSNKNCATAALRRLFIDPDKFKTFYDRMRNGDKIGNDADNRAIESLSQLAELCGVTITPKTFGVFRREEMGVRMKAPYKRLKTLESEARAQDVEIEAEPIPAQIEQRELPFGGWTLEVAIEQATARIIEAILLGASAIAVYEDTVSDPNTSAMTRSGSVATRATRLARNLNGELLKGPLV